MNIRKLQKKLNARFGGRVHVREEDGLRRVTGELDDWNDVVAACYMCAEKFSKTHVVNDIRFTGGTDSSVRHASLRDNVLEGRRPDVLVIGGGISGASILRELTKWKLDALLIEKGSDLAAGASSRNTGEVHPGMDLNLGSLKQHYEILGNHRFDTLCEELDVPFERSGQYACVRIGALRPILSLLCLYRRAVCGTRGTRIMGKKELYERNPQLAPGYKFAVYDWSAGVVCPYGLTIAMAENAVTNGASVSLNTECEGMELKDGRITAVHTNRGTIYPRIVVNAAGTFCEEIARMAGDRFFSIHPRRGTNSILDKADRALVSGVASGALDRKNVRAHTKGGCIAPTAHGNLLVGPDAVETWEKENYATTRQSVQWSFERQQRTVPALTERDMITCFTGVRAPSFEEDFILEQGRKTKNIVHVAAIQSPGLTAAPAFAVDMAALCVKLLGGAPENPDYDPKRHGYGRVAELSLDERETLIEKDPDYGVIVCRCEEVSKGEILDALRAPICVPTVDGIKRRVRPGSGRCQGGFCGPLVTQIIADYMHEPVEAVTKDGGRSIINFGPTKGQSREAEDA